MTLRYGAMLYPLSYHGFIYAVYVRIFQDLVHFEAFFIPMKMLKVAVLLHFILTILKNQNKAEILAFNRLLVNYNKQCLFYPPGDQTSRVDSSVTGQKNVL